MVEGSKVPKRDTIDPAVRTENVLLRRLKSLRMQGRKEEAAKYDEKLRVLRESDDWAMRYSM